MDIPRYHKNEAQDLRSHKQQKVGQADLAQTDFPIVPIAAPPISIEQPAPCYSGKSDYS